jgi:hypothetical protein
VIYARKVSRKNVGCGHTWQPIKIPVTERYCLVPLRTVHGECKLEPYSDNYAFKMTGKITPFLVM